MNMTRIEGAQDYINRIPRRCKHCGGRMYDSRNVFGMWTGTSCGKCGYTID